MPERSPRPRPSGLQAMALQVIRDEEELGVADLDPREVLSEAGVRGYGNQAAFLMTLIRNGWVTITTTPEGRRVLDARAPLEEWGPGTTPTPHTTPDAHE